MDCSGIDFVEADFGAEAAAGGLGQKMPRTPQDWNKWSNQKFRTPLKPFIFMGVIFVMLVSLPWILDFIQDAMIAEQSHTEEAKSQTAEQEVQETQERGQITAATAGKASEPAAGQAAQPPQYQALPDQAQYQSYQPQYEAQYPGYQTQPLSYPAQQTAASTYQYMPVQPQGHQAYAQYGTYQNTQSAAQALPAPQRQKVFASR